MTHKLSHYRNTSGTHEIDFIVHRGDDDIVAFEVKLAKAPDKDAVKHLLWMKEQLGSKLKDMVLITSGSDAAAKTGLRLCLRCTSLAASRRSLG
jgi:predicted AAA+ superfamily ATPase